MKTLFTSVLLVCATMLFAQTKSIQHSEPLTEAEPESAGVSSERLDRITKACEQAIEEDRIPGCVALVARNGKIVYHEAFGYADVEAGRRFKKDDVFRIASQTKAITTTAVMMLWEQGLFRLDDPIAKYIPEFGKAKLIESFNADDTTFTTKPAKHQITIRHLLTHTSGIGYGAIDGDKRFKMIYKKAGVTDLFTTEKITIEESVKKLARLPLHHEPGEKFTYSEGLDVLGYFIEVISGQRFDEYLHEHIFEPLAMNDTWFYQPKRNFKRLVPVQHKANGKWAHFPITFYDPEYPIKGEKTFFSGGAGLSSTATDYATFLQMMLNKGELNGIRLLSRTTVEFMLQNQIGNIWEGQGRYHCLGFSVVDKIGEARGGSGSAGTFDWGGYFNTQYFADPEEQIIGIIMKQTQNVKNDNTGWKFRQLVFQSVDD